MKPELLDEVSEEISYRDSFLCTEKTRRYDRVVMAGVSNRVVEQKDNKAFLGSNVLGNHFFLIFEGSFSFISG